MKCIGCGYGTSSRVILIGFASGGAGTALRCCAAAVIVNSNSRPIDRQRNGLGILLLPKVASDDTARYPPSQMPRKLVLVGFLICAGALAVGAQNKTWTPPKTPWG